MEAPPGSSLDVQDMLCAQALAVVSRAVKRQAIGGAVDVRYNAADVRRDLLVWAGEQGHDIVETAEGRLCITRRR